MATPPLPKPWSRVPLALNRMTANALFVPLGAVACVAARILSSDCTASFGEKLPPTLAGNAAKPPLPNVVSLVPFGRYRSSPESPVAVFTTETTMSPS